MMMGLEAKEKAKVRVEAKAKTVPAQLPSRAFKVFTTQLRTPSPFKGDGDI